MSYDQYKEGVKKRREERLRLLRRKQRLESPVGQSSYWDKDEERGYYSVIPLDDPEQREDHGSTFPMVIKIFLSLLFVAGVYLVMNSDNPRMAGTQDFIHEVLHREFNVAGVMVWYEEVAGESISFLPSIFQRSEQKRPGYSVPVTGGKVVSGFGQDRQGIMVGTSTTLPIEVIREGWVKSVGEMENLGTTIVIDHGDGEESWYGQIQDIKVQQNDWVQQGQVIGFTSVNEDSGQGIFYFALKKNSTFVDPLDVISFD